MGDRLVVDLDALDARASDLRGLAREFRGSARQGAAARAAVGHERVAGALEEFTDNWRRHRDALVSSLDAVAQMARDSHDAYVETDEQLAAELTKNKAK